jgi:hypothetical protein
VYDRIFEADRLTFFQAIGKCKKEILQDGISSFGLLPEKDCWLKVSSKPELWHPDGNKLLRKNLRCN